MMIREPAARIDELECINAELLAALKSIAMQPMPDEWSREIYLTPIEIARAAIKKAES